MKSAWQKTTETGQAHLKNRKDVHVIVAMSSQNNTAEAEDK